VADQAPRAQFRFLLHDRVQKDVGVQAALHQRSDFASTGSRGCLQGRILGAVRSHDPVFNDVQVSKIGDLSDFGLGAEQHGLDQPCLGGLHRPGQRIVAARVHHAGRHRLEALTALDQPFEPMLRDLASLPHRRRQNFQDRGRDNLARRVRASAVQHHDPLARPFFPHHEPNRHRRRDRQRPLDLYRDGAD